MVTEESRNGETVFICEECGFAYAEKAWACRCEEWCREHKSCNMEITKYALKGMGFSRG